MISAFGVEHGEVSKGFASAARGVGRAIKGKPYAGGVPTVRQMVGLSMPLPARPKPGLGRVPRTRVGMKMSLARSDRKIARLDRQLGDRKIAIQNRQMGQS